MEISEIKKKIMERIEDEKSKTSRKKKPLTLDSLSAKIGKPKEELLRILNKTDDEPAVSLEPVVPVKSDAVPGEAEGYQVRLENLEEENLKLKKVKEEARFKSDNLLNQIAEKDKAIADLQKKLASESISIIKDSEKEKSLINTAIEKSIAEYRAKLADLEEENSKLKDRHAAESKNNEDIFFQIAEKDKEIAALKKKFQEEAGELEKTKKLKKLHEDALKQNDSLLIRLEEKDKELVVLEKRLEEAHGHTKKAKDSEKSLEEKLAEKEKAASNVEGLRSKIYAATKEIKEQAARILQLEEMVKNREKKFAESDKALKKTEKERDDLIVKLQASEESRRSMDEKIKNISVEIEAKDKKVTEAEKFYNKNMSVAKKEMELHVQAIERSKKTLEGKIAQLNIELDAKNKRIEETEESNRELDNLVKESAVKLQSIEGAKGDIEERLKQIEVELTKMVTVRQNDKAAAEENITTLKSEMEALATVIKDKEKCEEELKDNVMRLEAEIEARDKKIQSDIKYCEGVVKEVNDLRQKIKAYRLKVK